MLTETFIRNCEDIRAKSKLLREQSFTVRYAVSICNTVAKCIMKKCSKCGAEYRPSQWKELPLCGHMEVGGTGGELRHCPCGNTLTIITRREQAT